MMSEKKPQKQNEVKAAEGLMKVIKTVIIDDAALFRSEKTNGLPKAIADSLRKIGDMANIVVCTTNADSVKKLFADTFTVEKETEIPVMVEVPDVDGKTKKVRQYKKQMAKVQDLQPTIVATPDVASFSRYLTFQNETGNRDTWILTSNEKLLKKYFNVNELYMVPNLSTLKTSSGYDFKFFLVKDVKGWKEIITLDDADLVRPSSSTPVGPDNIDKDVDVDTKTEEIIPENKGRSKRV
jgi:hypothetical protein